MVAASLALLPVEFLAAKTTSPEAKQNKQLVKKISYKKSKAKKAKVKLRKQGLAKQRAIDLGENYDGSSMLELASNKALVVNQDTGEVIYAKNTNVPSPIASITKLMTAMVVLDSQQSLNEVIQISQDDVDTIKGTRSRLPVGTSLTRAEMLQLALMSSENRAAYALASNYPGGQSAFIKAMNTKSLSLGLMHTRFAEPTGLMYQNVSTAEDLYKLVSAAYQYPEIRNATTTASYEVYVDGREKPTEFRNTNSLVRGGEWDIGLSKTGYINEAGRCLVMQAKLAGEPMIVVFLDASGTNKRIGDANRVRKWIEFNHHPSESEAIVAGEEDMQPQLVMSEHIYEN